MRINPNFAALSESYLFSAVAGEASAYAAAHPGCTLLRMGIGDVTRPLPPVVTQAMEEAAREMGDAAAFRGYGPEQGYLFLREAIAAYRRALGAETDPEDIFVSDGAKSDLGGLTQLFSSDNTVLVPDPVYPVYVDTNLMDGRRLLYARGTPENGFLPLPEEDASVDIIYICSPNNPTGAVYTREGLQAWVDYANRQGAVILFDNAYEGFIADPDLPRSIFALPGAETCAMEISSFSKLAGFTGVRCGYTVISPKLVRQGSSLRQLWLRRQAAKYNGASYIVQRGAEAALSPAGLAECRENIAFYRENARILGEALDGEGISYTGGKHSPYLWFRCPGEDSWGAFRRLLAERQIVTTPGAGFGAAGEGNLRMTAFSTREVTLEAADRLRGFIRKDRQQITKPGLFRQPGFLRNKCLRSRIKCIKNYINSLTKYGEVVY